MKMNGGFLVTKIKQLGDRIFEKILSEKNIDAFNGAQGRILYVLWQEDGISIRSLSMKCGLAITSLTTMLERMEHQGLIRRVQSETDKRKTLLFLTEKAHALKDKYDSVSDKMGSIYYKGFSEEEITVHVPDIISILFVPHRNLCTGNHSFWQPDTICKIIHRSGWNITTGRTHIGWQSHQSMNHLMQCTIAAAAYHTVTTDSLLYDIFGCISSLLCCRNRNIPLSFHHQIYDIGKFVPQSPLSGTRIINE